MWPKQEEVEEGGEEEEEEEEVVLDLFCPVVFFATRLNGRTLANNKCSRGPCRNHNSRKCGHNRVYGSFDAWEDSHTHMRYVF